ncbi:MAG: sigma 54 modulation protein / ribosomal protein [Actinomycetia bacterium]|nr:sigma 54 modulation protein / ribosomal protein [Actinomycetes bacterium]
MTMHDGQASALEIVVRAKRVDLDERVRDAAREKLGRIRRFAKDASRAEVDFSELKNPRIAANQVCEATVHLRRHVVKAHAAAKEQLAALDLCVEKLEHQVAKLKEKRVARAHPRRRDFQTHAMPADDYAHEQNLAASEPDTEARLVRTKQLTMQAMSPVDAALQMELLGHDFFLFTNAENHAAAVLYRRHDGHLGLIEGSS